MKANAQVQRSCVALTVFGFTLTFVGLIPAHFFPFPSPNHSALYIARFYMSHKDGIRLGCVLVSVGAALTAPLAAVIAVHMRRIEGEFSPLAYIELGMGCTGALAITTGTFFWQAAAFRPERAPMITQSWHDAGWLCFVATVFIFLVQHAALAAAILTDKRATPLFPRWLGYLVAAVCVLVIPSVLCLWFKTGPFAWNGAATLYLGFVALGVMFGPLLLNILRVIKEQETELSREQDAELAVPVA